MSEELARRGRPAPQTKNPANEELTSIMRVITVLAAIAFATAVVAASGAEKPNIVFVLFDDLGYGQPASYRAESRFNMPNFDRLTREGMRFTDAHSPAANCTPTRYGLLTGRYPARIGQFNVLTTYSSPIIPPDRVTLPSLLKQHGYHTACIGKWHLGMTWADGKPGEEFRLPIGARLSAGPGTAGFDYFKGFTHARNIGSIIEQNQVVANVKSVENQPLMIQQALQYIDGRKADAEPFFLYFPMCPPHTPIVPAPSFVGRGGVSGEESKYADWVYQGDHMLGQILEAIDRIGQTDNTLVIATGDNGAAKRAYLPLRASKGSIYEGGHREPFVARWPGRIQANSRSGQTICLTDMVATVAELLGVQLPDQAAEDSFSILSLLLGEADAPVREATIHQSPRGLAIRQGPWKLIFHRGGNRELFHLQDDLGEQHDVQGEHPDVVERLTKLMQRYIRDGRSTPGAPQENEFPLTLSF